MNSNGLRQRCFSEDIGFRGRLAVSYEMSTMNKMRHLVLILMGLSISFFLGRFSSSRHDLPQIQATEVRDQVSTQQAEYLPPEAYSTSGYPNEFSTIYARLGLRTGDTIFDVNGSIVPRGFMILRTAYKAGDLCVHYERDGLHRKVCFKRNDSGEHITDLPFPS